MHPRRRALLRRSAAVVATALVVGSCSGDAEPPAPATGTSDSGTASTSPSPTPSESPEASATAETGPPEPPAMPRPPRPRPGPEGQRAFAEHVVAAWAWSLQANDAAPLLAASRSPARPCSGCRELARELRDRDREGWYVDLPPIGLGGTRLRRDGEEVVASTRVDIPESDTYFYDGSFRSTSPPHEDATFEVRMRRTDDRYVLVSFTLA